MPVELNAIESARFGITAARVRDPATSPQAIDVAAQEMGVQMLMVRLPVADLPRVHLFEAAGYRLMDTLVYYGRDLADPVTAEAAPEGIALRLAEPDDAGKVAEVARAGFNDYLGHYHADPRLDSTAADAAYVEWAETSTANASSVAPVLVAEAAGGIVGFLTLRQNSPEEMEIVLNAVDPACHGRGIYRSLAIAALELARSRGSTRMIVSTQINNYGVQRIWSRLGFCHERSMYTFHKWF